MFLPFSTYIPRADKGSFLRPKCYKLFEDTIEGVYKRLEGEGEEEGVERKDVGDISAVEEYVMEIVKDVEGGEGLEMDTDLFDRGLDSLQATRIRNAIQRVSSVLSSVYSSDASLTLFVLISSLPGSQPQGCPPDDQLCL